MKALVLSKITPSIGYFVQPYLKQFNYEIYLTENFQNISHLEKYQLCVVSRYVSNSNLKLIAKLKQQGCKIVYFMDDDLFDFRALKGLPYRYQWKIFTQALIHQKTLRQLCDEFWFSTPYLTQKYASLNPVLLFPQPITTQTLSTPISVCYHGTASHQSELEWLKNIVTTVQSQTDMIHFEFFGHQKINRLFAGLPRVSVIHPMLWENYLHFTSTQKRDIALAPLLNNRFNAARGVTKFYDYARLNAVGIYSDVEPYQGFIHHGVDGLKLKNDPTQWVDSILELALNPKQRQTMSEAIQQRVATESMEKDEP